MTENLTLQSALSEEAKLIFGIIKHCFLICFAPHPYECLALCPEGVFRSHDLLTATGEPIAESIASNSKLDLGKDDRHLQISCFNKESWKQPQKILNG